MKSIIAVAVVVSGLVLASAPAGAGERLNEAALGAGSGLLVAGPVGAVAGGVIGYVAGPNIRRGLGVNHHRRAYRPARRNTARVN